MNYHQFLNEIQAYYGNWKTTKSKKSPVKEIIHSYLVNDIRQDKLDDLKRFTFYSHPLKFGAPGIQAFEKAIEEAIKKRNATDIRKVRITSTLEKTKRLTSQERKEGIEILKKNKGLSGMMKKFKEKQNAWKKEKFDFLKGGSA